MNRLTDPQARQNRATLLRQVRALQRQHRRIAEGGGPDAVARHRQRGKGLVRERMAQLIDPNSPLLELSMLAAHEVYDDPVPAAALVTAIGWVAGRPCMLIGNDATVKGGSYYPLTVKKHLRAQQIALENRLPCLYLVDSGGAHLPLQDQVFPDREHFGRIFFNQARLSAAGIPQLALVLGSCTAGGAYIPAMSDETLIVAGTGTIFLAGPPLVEAATGERIDAQSLGGADVHCERSGVADHYAEDEAEALAMARRIVARFPLPVPHYPIDAEAPAPRYPAEELYALIPSDLRQPLPVHPVIERLVDHSEFDEFKARYGRTLVCGFARLYGMPVGIVANEGVLFAESALKGAHFIELCSQRQIPLLFLQNITGFVVGSPHEQEGIAKQGAKLVTAVACTAVPKLTLIMGGSFGAGNYGMCGRAYDPRFLFSWPSARVAVMGPEQAADVLTRLQWERAQAAGQALDNDARQALREPILARYRQQAEAWYGSARLWDDGVIDPAQTRQVLGQALAVAAHGEVTPSRFGVFRF